MTCPNCQSANRPSARFCEECGTKLPRACPQCGAAVGPAAKFCGECGPALAAAPAPAASAPPLTLEEQFRSFQQRLPSSFRFESFQLWSDTGTDR
jgi:adenylate cyclase